MKISLIVPDNAVYVDGRPVELDLGTLAKNVHAVQWDSETKSGHIERLDGANEELTESDFNRLFKNFSDSAKSVLDEKDNVNPTLEKVVARRRAEFNLLRETTFADGVAFNGKVIDSDPTSVRKITGAVLMAVIAKSAGSQFSIDWTCADDSVITLDADGMINLGLAVGVYGDELHQRTRAAKQRLAEAASIEDALAVEW